MSRLLFTFALFCACIFLSTVQPRNEPQSVIAISARRANKVFAGSNQPTTFSTFAARQFISSSISSTISPAISPTMPSAIAPVGRTLPASTTQSTGVLTTTTGDMISPKFDSEHCLAVDVPDATEGHDHNGDGQPDREPISVDSDGDGLEDAYDTVPTTLLTAENALGAELQLPDHNQNGVPDYAEIGCPLRQLYLPLVMR